MGKERDSFFKLLPAHLTYEPVKSVTIGTRIVGEGNPAFIIAEIGANHHGKLEDALVEIEAAAKAGANAVKFQHLTHDKIAADTPVETAAGMTPLSTLYASMDTPNDWTPALIAKAKECGVLFFSTPFDVEAVDVLDSLGVAVFKIASCELTDDLLVRHIACKGKPIIVSTGMAYLEEVAHAVRVMQEEGNTQIIILHCIAMYPPKSFEDLNLRAITTLQEAFKVPVGFSDHTAPGTVAAPLAAVTLGACVIEKHFTIDQKGGAPDDANSLNPEQFQTMVMEIRALEAAMKGSGIKQPVSRGEHAPGEDEIPDRWAHRSIYSARDIAAGETLTLEMIITLRPQGGIEPKDFHIVEGKKLTKFVAARQPLTFDLFFS